MGSIILKEVFFPLLHSHAEGNASSQTTLMHHRKAKSALCFRTIAFATQPEFNQLIQPGKPFIYQEVCPSV